MRLLFVLLAVSVFAHAPVLAGAGDRDLTTPTTITGRVRLPDGSPAVGAVVVTSAGGECVTDASGSYSLEVAVPLAANRVQVFAVGGSPRFGESLTGSTDAFPVAHGETIADGLQLADGDGSPGWLSTIGGAPGVDGTIWALTVFDDGGGRALYAAGSFAGAGGVVAQRIAKWDGARWSPLGSGMNDTVRSLAVFDDGTGAALYAGGSFTRAGGVLANRIAKWDGIAWSRVGTGMNSDVLALAVHDDGSGPALHAGGSFTMADGALVNYVAAWDGTRWAPRATGTSGVVRALAVYDDGTGAALYAGGSFTMAGGNAASRIARWDGADWSPLGSGMNFGLVTALTVFDDGSGDVLVAAGAFGSAGGVATNGIARWDGSGWSAFAAGLGGLSPLAYSLAVHDDGAGPALFVGGDFAFPGATGARGIARWDGSAWIPVGGGTDGSVRALATFGPRSGGGGIAPAAELFAGGLISTLGTTFVRRLGRWDGTGWSAVESSRNGISGDVLAVARFDDGFGPALYAGGELLTAGGTAVNRVAKWDGTRWSPLAGGVDDGVRALEVFDDGSGPALYVAGDFDTAGGIAVDRIARWDGAAWSALAGGTGPDGSVRALAVHDDGSGPALYAGGSFSTAGGVSARRVARWDGTAWSALGAGIGGVFGNAVHALEVFDAGAGASLYAAGDFTNAGGAPGVNHIAEWDGSVWRALGTGLGGRAFALEVFDDGGGPALFVGGDFSSAGGLAAEKLARWSAAGWSIPSGIAGAGSSIQALAVHDDGSGRRLVAGGRFATAGGIAVRNIACFDGASWRPFGRGLPPAVFALLSAEASASSPTLWVAGGFSASSAGDSYLTRWGCVSE